MDYRKIVYIFCLAFLLPLISACSFWSSDRETDNWKNEVLMAGACGEEGLMCCIDQDPVCKYGSCCVDPNNANNNYCSESCEFGKLDTFCRTNNDCDDGLACFNSYCTPCGESSQPCCQDKSCSGTLACFRDTCVECGLTGNPCCLTEPFCEYEGITKELNRNECKEELCSECGANGNVPCKDKPRCNEDHLLNNNHCFRCGGFNQPCCQNITPEGTEKYCVEDGLSCKLDFCSK